jgi:hypothetical protein
MTNDDLKVECLVPNGSREEPPGAGFMSPLSLGTGRSIGSYKSAAVEEPSPTNTALVVQSHTVPVLVASDFDPKVRR